jgi:hypothetical protein
MRARLPPVSGPRSGGLTPDKPLTGKVAHSTRHSSEHGDQLNLDQRVFR